MRCSLFAFVASGALFWGVGLALAAAPPVKPPQAPLPEPVKTLLLEASRTSFPTNTSAKRPVKVSPKPQATNEVVLHLLRWPSWPDYTQMKRVRVGKTGSGSPLQPRWLYQENGDQLFLVSDGLGKERRDRAGTRVELVDFAAELDALLKPWQNAATGTATKLRLGPEHGLELGIAAAWLGYTNQARQLFQLALRAPNLKHEVSDAAYRDYGAGLKLLRSGAKWDAVLAQWEKQLDTYGTLGVPPELEDNLDQLRLQVEEPPHASAKKSKGIPKDLSPAERAAYLVDRLTEQRPNDPGDEAIQRQIVALGQDAVPALIAHLRDRRLTRLTGELGELITKFTVSGNYVFRVQDVALLLLERTAHVTFLDMSRLNYQSRPPPLSLREPAEREKLAENVEAWWAGIGSVPPERWRLEALNRLPFYSRVNEVMRLEQLAPKATNYLTVLQSWTNEVREPVSPFYIRALAERGDPSLIPWLRKEWQRGLFKEMDLLLRFGSAEDIGHLRDADRRRHLVDPSQLGSTYSFGLTQLLDASRNGRAITNRLLVPLLVDQLKQRQPSQTVRVLGEQWAKISRAEAAMQALMTLTGHDEGYSLAAHFDTRNAVVERWEQWWNKAGEQVWLTLHPETKAAFGTGVTAPTVDNVAALPPMVRVQVAEGEPNRFFLMPREQLQEQLRTRAVEGRQLGELTQFRFTSPASEAKWFLQAKALPTTNLSLTVKLGTSYAGQMSLHRPALTTNAFLAPSLHVKSCLLAIGDSRGRAWMAMLAAGTTTISRHEAGQWKTIFTLPAGPSGWSSEQEIQYALPLRDGALLLGIGRGDSPRLHLLHGNDHLEFSHVESLFEREAPRLRKLISFPPDQRERAVGLNPSLVLAKDQGGNLWWAKYGKCGMVGVTNRVTATAEEIEPGGRGGYFKWFSPLPQTGGVVAGESNDRARLLTVDGKRLRAGAPQPIPLPGNSEQPWPRFLAGRNGGFWVSAKESVMFDSSLKRVTSQSGWLVLRDAKEMMWFLDYKHSQDANLIRRDKEGQVTKLHLRGLAGPPCEHGDGSIWISTDGGVARIVSRSGRLEVVEEALGVGVNRARMWRDPEGLLWVAETDDRRQELTAYSMRH